MKYTFPALAFFFLLVSPRAAEPVETGFIIAPAYLPPGRFTKSMKGFRSSLDPFRPGVTRAENFDSMLNREFWLRVGDLFGPRHWIGFSVGDYISENFAVQEARTDPSYIDTDWSFKFSYFSLNYDFRDKLSRKWSWEGHVALGFLTLAQWRVNGVRANSAGPQRYDSVHLARFGNLWRLGLGLHRVLGKHLILRTGLRATYFYFGDFRGRENRLDSQWYYTRDGGLIQLTPLDVEEIILTRNTAAGDVPDKLLFLREKAYPRFGALELYLSLGLRF